MTLTSEEIAVCRAEGRAAEVVRINAILDFSIAWHGCVTGVAQDLAFESSRPVDECKDIIRRYVCVSEALQ